MFFANLMNNLKRRILLLQRSLFTLKEERLIKPISYQSIVYLILKISLFFHFKGIFLSLQLRHLTYKPSLKLQVNYTLSWIEFNHHWELQIRRIILFLLLPQNQGKKIQILRVHLALSILIKINLMEMKSNLGDHLKN